MNKKPSTKNQELIIGWLYPELMSTYGDSGNIMVLLKRCQWRGINVKIINIDQKSKTQDLKSIDLLFAGGAQDKEQSIVIKYLKKHETEIRKLIEREVPALFVCGAPQLFGKYYEPSVGKRIEGLGIFDMTSIHPGPKKERLIGNIVADVNWQNLYPKNQELRTKSYMVGFENHGGRTCLGPTAVPFAKVLKGYGNNGEDKTEGVVYKNAIGTYFHGPLLSKNPEIADFLIAKALFIKYSKEIELKKLDNTLEQKARQMIARRLGIKL